MLQATVAADETPKTKRLELVEVEIRGTTLDAKAEGKYKILQTVSITDIYHFLRTIGAYQYKDRYGKGSIVIKTKEPSGEEKLFKIPFTEKALKDYGHHTLNFRQGDRIFVVEPCLL